MARGSFNIFTHEIYIDPNLSPEIQRGVLAHELCHKRWHLKSNGEHTFWGKINHWLARRNKIIQYILVILFFHFIFELEEIDCHYAGIRASKELEKIYEKESTEFF